MTPPPTTPCPVCPAMFGAGTEDTRAWWKMDTYSHVSHAIASEAATRIAATIFGPAADASGQSGTR